MSQFGKRGGGGRRVASRKGAKLYAKLRTRSEILSVELVDLSKTGAGLAGGQLPSAGTELFLKVESMDVFGEVAWSAGTLCGVTFDTPLSDDELAALQEEARLVELAGLTPSEKVSLDSFYLSRG